MNTRERRKNGSSDNRKPVGKSFKEKESRKKWEGGEDVEVGRSKIAREREKKVKKEKGKGRIGMNSPY